MNEKCRLCREILSDEELGGLDTWVPGLEETVAAHLEQCDECQAVQQALSGLDQQLNKIQELPVPPSLQMAVIEAVAKEPYPAKGAPAKPQSIPLNNILPTITVLIAIVVAMMFVLNPGSEQVPISGIRAIFDGRLGAVIFTVLLLASVFTFAKSSRKGLRSLSPFSMQGGLVSLALLLLMVRTNRNMLDESDQVLNRERERAISERTFSEANYDDTQIRGPIGTAALAASQAANDISTTVGGVFGRSDSTAFSKVGSSILGDQTSVQLDGTLAIESGKWSVQRADHAPSTPPVSTVGGGGGGEAKMDEMSAGRRAVTVETEPTSGIEGFVAPGSHVDVVVTSKDKKDGSFKSRIAVEDARILSASRDVGAGGEEKFSRAGKQEKSAVTLDVGAVDALKLQAAKEAGEVSLILREPNNTGSTDITFNDIVGKSPNEPLNKPSGRVRYRDENGVIRDLEVYGNDKIETDGDEANVRRQALPEQAAGEKQSENDAPQPKTAAQSAVSAANESHEIISSLKKRLEEESQNNDERIRKLAQKLRGNDKSNLPSTLDEDGVKSPNQVSSRSDHGSNITKGLNFLDPNGYWENTYVPGDPTLRALNTRLIAEAGNFPALSANGKRLHEMAEQILQPFDAPKDAALGVFINADRKGIDGESRLLVQVGLKGILRASGQRAALNSAIVADLRGNPGLEIKRITRAIVTAFAQKKESSDKLRLYLLTDRGLSQVQPDDFRLGYLTVELDKQFEAAPTAAATQIEMTAALREAVESVAQNDDPNAPLGSSSAVVITTRPLGSENSTLISVARQSAIAGVPVSVIGVGPNAVKSEIEELALAGQGTRREVSEASAADKAVDQELASAGNVVARAIRLQIKLAPGVKLVEVIGSQKLDKKRSAQVKEAEESIDLRVAKSMGITTDRGNDEEGIQIVIPSFYAGDSHVILLDVVAPGTGPVATVNAKFKDLVFLKNGTAQSSLTLSNSEQGAGPLELNVMKNMLALRLSTTLEQAGAALGSGSNVVALGLVANYERLLQAAADRTIGLGRDNEIAADLRLVQYFIQTIQRPELVSSSARTFVANSLTVAGKKKIHTIQTE